MNSTLPCLQKDMFALPTETITKPLVLELRGIQVPANKSRKDQIAQQPKPNFHVPSFKNSKMLVAKDFRGRPLAKPFLITKPEFQEWKERAVQSLESQLLSMCQTGCDATPQVLSRLSVMLSRIPADDSVSDLPQGGWTVDLVPAGQEGATITIERLE